MNRLCHTVIAFATAMLSAAAAHGRVLEVGPARAVTLPSQAADAAVSGEFVRTDPGAYADLPGRTVFFRHSSAAPVVLEGNTITGDAQSLRTGTGCFFGQ